MYDLMIEPEQEDTGWCWEEVEGALEAIGLSASEGGCIAANAEGTVWVDVGSPDSPDVLLIAVRAREDRRVETIRQALDIAFYLAQRLGGVVIDMQLGGRVLPENREWVETEFLR
ncbi:MAG: hypothetical protein KatS3mg023_0483 [Armatimonadota bacterium]|nr:MAG: hypothetical protein KatS3mg023_0483 [Armatimonadota bacterium]